jgi:hypothetical protein
MEENNKMKPGKNLPNAIGNSKEIIKLDKHQEEIEGQNKFAKEIMERKISFIQRLLPTSEQKIAIQLKGQLIEQQGSATLERCRMNNEFFRQALKATYDMILKKGLEANQRELAETGIINKAALDSKISKLTEDYFNEMEKLEESILETKSDNIQQRKHRMLTQRMDEFEGTVTILMEQYKSINEKEV